MLRSSALAFGILVIAAPLPALADARTDVMGAAERCSAIADPRNWLDCYYGAAQAMRAQLGLSPAPAAQRTLVPPAPPGPGPQARTAMAEPAAPPQTATLPPGRGAFVSVPGGDKDYEPTQRPVSYSFDKNRLFTVTLADGAVWKQIVDDGRTAHWRGPAENFTISIVPGMFRSHLLRSSDGHSYRVDKVQ